MSDPKQPTPPATVSAEEARAILARAASLDSVLAGSYSIDELRRAAAEANIHPDAIDAALAELRASKPTPSRRQKLLKALGFCGFGAAFGVLALATDNAIAGPGAAAAVFGPSALFTLYRAFRTRRHGSVSDFIREIAAFFGSFTIAVTAIEGTQATGIALFWSAICALVGVGIASAESRQTPQSAQTSPEQAHPEQPPV